MISFKSNLGGVVLLEWSLDIGYMVSDLGEVVTVRDGIRVNMAYATRAGGHWKTPGRSESEVISSVHVS